MSDTDSDYCDVGTEDFESIFDVAGIQDNIRNKKTNANGKRVRGKDINWLPVKTFDNIEDYEQSDLLKKIKSDFTLQRLRKFSRKVGFLPCHLKYKVDFLSNSDEVVVNSNDTLEKHLHGVDTDDSNSGSSFKWTDAII